MANYRELSQEIQNDPLTRGYSGMTDQQVADDLNTAYRDNWVDIPNDNFFEAIDRTEFQSLNAGNKARVDRLLRLVSMPTGPDSTARAEILDIFGASSNTVANLAAVANQKVTRAQEIGFGRTVEARDIGRVR